MCCCTTQTENDSQHNRPLLSLQTLTLSFLSTHVPSHITNNRSTDRQHQAQYFAKCDAAIQKWRQEGPKPLNTGFAVDGSRLPDPVPEYTSGIFLFLDRQNITHSFLPNFLPPYDDEEKRKIILNFLKEEWDEKSRAWKPVK